AGKAAIVTDVRVTDAGREGAIVADAVLTSAVLVPEGGPPRWARPAHMQAPPPDGSLPSFVERLGIRDVDGSPAGAVELDAVDGVRNPWGIVHGGVTAALVDISSERAAAAALGRSLDAVVTSDVALHFLSPSRVGPVRASAVVVGDRADGIVLRV